MNVTHPATARVAQVDDYHGMRIDDPYRWLEDLDSAETAAWVATQDDFAHRLLDRLPEREGLRARLEKLWNYERRTAPARRGSRSFYFRNSGLQNQDILYVQERSNSDERVLLGPQSAVRRRDRQSCDITRQRDRPLPGLCTFHLGL